MPGIITFSKRQLPDGVLTVTDVAGPASWRFDSTFLEAADGVRRFFTTQTDFVPDKMMVYVDGLKAVRTLQYIQRPPNVVEFVVAPALNAAVETIYLVPLSEEGSLWVFDETPAGVHDGVNTDYTTFFPYVSGLIQVYRNGRKLQKGLSLNWVEIDNRTIRVNVPPLFTDAIELAYMIQV